MTSKDTNNATSLLVSEGGLTPYVWQGGQMINQYGPEVVPANLLVQPEEEEVSTMKGICGQPGINLSKSYVLTQSLESRLQARMALLGSTLYKLTWKRRDTPLGRSIFALRASALPTSASASGWLPTPCASEGNDVSNPTSLARLDRGGRVLRRICNKSQTIRSHLGTVRPNPSFLLWMMGYPQGWSHCAPSALEMPLSHKSRQK